jgi:hypothetical protein
VLQNTEEDKVVKLMLSTSVSPVFVYFDCASLSAYELFLAYGERLSGVGVLGRSKLLESSAVLDQLICVSSSSSSQGRFAIKGLKPAGRGGKVPQDTPILTRMG